MKCLLCSIPRALNLKLMQELFLAECYTWQLASRVAQSWLYPRSPTGSPPISQHYSLISFSQTQKMGTFSRTSLNNTKNVDQTLNFLEGI